MVMKKRFIIKSMLLEYLTQFSAVENDQLQVEQNTIHFLNNYETFLGCQIQAKYNVTHFCVNFFYATNYIENIAKGKVIKVILCAVTKKLIFT